MIPISGSAKVSGLVRVDDDARRQGLRAAWGKRARLARVTEVVIQFWTFMDLQIRGNVAVITGGASGIGWACATAFAREGCAVALWDLAANTEEQAQHLAGTG